MQISWLGDTQVEIKTKNAVIKAGKTVHVNDIDLPGVGEYEISGVEVQGIVKGIFYFKAEDISIAFLDGISRELENEEIGQLGDAEILIIPIGKEKYLNSKSAASLIKSIEPKIIIPIGEKADMQFCEQSGECKTQPNPYKITKQQINQMEGQETIILSS